MKLHLCLSIIETRNKDEVGRRLRLADSFRGGLFCLPEDRVLSCVDICVALLGNFVLRIRHYSICYTDVS
jgi:hypothetical protein